MIRPMNNIQERAEISEHEVKIYKALSATPVKWMTHVDIEKSSSVNARTVRAHVLRLVRLGLVDVAELFPRHRYRLSEKGVRRNKAYLQRLEIAAEILAEAA